jgi:hypothetical protein
LKLANTTNFPDEKIREIIQFVKPNNLPNSNFDVRVTNSSGHYNGMCYWYGCGYAKKGVGSNPNRPLIIARVSPDENKFPHQENHVPTRTVKLYWDQYDDRKGEWETWHISHLIAISKAYINRRNRELREKGKSYDWNKSAGGYIDCLVLSREEALVHILAHEIRHLWQRNHSGKRGKVWGARGQFSDRDADAYAIRKMREWRRLHAVDIYQEQPDILASSELAAQMLVPLIY